MGSGRSVGNTTHFDLSATVVVVYLVSSVFWFVVVMQKFLRFLPDFVNTYAVALVDQNTGDVTER